MVDCNLKKNKNLSSCKRKSEESGCWKKDKNPKENLWINRKDKKSVEVISDGEGNYNTFGHIILPGNRLVLNYIEESKTKGLAIKKAKIYMKRDKC